MAISAFIIIVGFILMSGGGSVNSMDFHPEIFSFRRIVMAPIFCVVGFVLMIYAILANPNKKK